MSAPSIPHVSPALARSAREHLQCLYAEPQTDDDGLEMATNLLGAYGVWRDWKRRRDEQSASPAPVIPSRKPKRRDSSPSTQE